MRSLQLIRRARRLLHVASSPYPISARAILEAGSIDDLQRLALGKSGLGFNDQILRIAYLIWLFGAAGCSVFMETGTYKGITSLAARRLFGTTVLTVEKSLGAYLSSRLLALIARSDGIHYERGDSGRVLRRWLSELADSGRPMIYLDAHWFTESPLRREIAAALGRGNCVVVIDDCRVEADPDFGYDSQDFGEGSPWTFTIALSSIADMLPVERVVVLQPTYRASQETGRRRGCTILLIDLALSRADPSFASTLFAPVSAQRVPLTPAMDIH